MPKAMRTVWLSVLAAVLAVVWVVLWLTGDRISVFVLIGNLCTLVVGLSGLYRTTGVRRARRAVPEGRRTRG